MKGGKRDKKMYYKWRNCSLNLQPACYLMTDFGGSKKAQLEVATHQNIKRVRGDGVPKLETAVLFATSSTMKNLIIWGRYFKTDTGSPFCHYCVFPFT